MGKLEYGRLQHILFALGRAIQDLYISEKGGGGNESTELQKRVKEGLDLLRFLGIGLEAEMIFDIEADEEREHLFVVGADWTGSEDRDFEPEMMAELKVAVVLFKSGGGETVERGNVTAGIVSEPELGGDDFEGLPAEKNPPPPMPEEPLTAADRKFLRELGVVATPERESEATLNPHIIRDAAISFALNLQSCYIEEKLGEKRKAAILRKKANDIMNFLHSKAVQVEVTVQDSYPREDGGVNKLEIRSSWPPEDDAETKFHLCLDIALTISEEGKKIIPGDINGVFHRADTDSCMGKPAQEDAEAGPQDSKLISSEESNELWRGIFGGDPPTEEPA